MGKFIISKRTNDEFQFNLKASNGEIILSSEGYKTKVSCKNGIESVQKNSPEIKMYEIKEAQNGKFHFNLKASNGQVIGTSQLYASEASCKNGIESVMKNAPSATIVDETEQQTTITPTHRLASYILRRLFVKKGLRLEAFLYPILYIKYIFYILEMHLLKTRNRIVLVIYQIIHVSSTCLFQCFQTIL